MVELSTDEVQDFSEELNMAVSKLTFLAATLRDLRTEDMMGLGGILKDIRTGLSRVNEALFEKQGL